MDLTLNCKQATITPNGRNYVTVEIVGADDKSDLLDALSVQDLIKYFGTNDVLDEIGEEAAKDYWNLIDP